VHFFKFFVILCVLVCFAVKAQFTSRAIFGGDTIVEATKANSTLRKASLSVAMMIANNAYTQINGKITIDREFFLPAFDSQSHSLCLDERFSKQYSNPVTCTGFLIGEDLLLTAGHCMLNFGRVTDSTSGYCEHFSWLFDYKRENGESVKLSNIDESKLYRCKKIVAASFDLLKEPIASRLYDHDYALIELDRKVRDRPYLNLSKRKVRKGQVLSIVGHPLGLPMKAATNGLVNLANHPYYFELGISSFSGSSGSPLLNRKGEAVGILVRGPEEFLFDKQNQCQRFIRCDLNGQNCDPSNDDENYQHGMHCQRLDPVLRYIK
jgi:V8-like Glu-specific endopeptidase